MPPRKSSPYVGAAAASSSSAAAASASAVAASLSSSSIVAAVPASLGGARAFESYVGVVNPEQSVILSEEVQKRLISELSRLIKSAGTPWTPHFASVVNNLGDKVSSSGILSDFFQYAPNVFFITNLLRMLVFNPSNIDIQFSEGLKVLYQRSQEVITAHMENNQSVHFLVERCVTQLKMLDEALQALDSAILPRVPTTSNFPAVFVLPPNIFGGRTTDYGFREIVNEVDVAGLAQGFYLTRIGNTVELKFDKKILNLKLDPVLVFPNPVGDKAEYRNVAEDFNFQAYVNLQITERPESEGRPATVRKVVGTHIYKVSIQDLDVACILNFVKKIQDALDVFFIKQLKEKNYQNDFLKFLYQIHCSIVRTAPGSANASERFSPVFYSEIKDQKIASALNFLCAVVNFSEFYQFLFECQDKLIFCNHNVVAVREKLESTDLAELRSLLSLPRRHSLITVAQALLELEERNPILDPAGEELRKVAYKFYDLKEQLAEAEEALLRQPQQLSCQVITEKEAAITAMKEQIQELRDGSIENLQLPKTRQEFNKTIPSETPHKVFISDERAALSGRNKYTWRDLLTFIHKVNDKRQELQVASSQVESSTEEWRRSLQRMEENDVASHTAKFEQQRLSLITRYAELKQKIQEKQKTVTSALREVLTKIEDKLQQAAFADRKLGLEAQSGFVAALRESEQKIKEDIQNAASDAMSLESLGEIEEKISSYHREVDTLLSGLDKAPKLVRLQAIRKIAQEITYNNASFEKVKKEKTHQAAAETYPQQLDEKKQAVANLQTSEAIDQLPDSTTPVNLAGLNTLDTDLAQAVGSVNQLVESGKKSAQALADEIDHERNLLAQQIAVMRAGLSDLFDEIAALKNSQPLQATGEETDRNLELMAKAFVPSRLPSLTLRILEEHRSQLEQYGKNIEALRFAKNKLEKEEREKAQYETRIAGEKAIAEERARELDQKFHLPDDSGFVSHVHETYAESLEAGRAFVKKMNDSNFLKAIQETYLKETLDKKAPLDNRENKTHDQAAQETQDIRSLEDCLANLQQTPDVLQDLALNWNDHVAPKLHNASGVEQKIRTDIQTAQRAANERGALMQDIDTKVSGLKTKISAVTASADAIKQAVAVWRDQDDSNVRMQRATEWLATCEDKLRGIAEIQKKCENLAPLSLDGVKNLSERLSVHEADLTTVGKELQAAKRNAAYEVKKAKVKEDLHFIAQAYQHITDLLDSPVCDPVTSRWYEAQAKILEKLNAVEELDVDVHANLVEKFGLAYRAFKKLTVGDTVGTQAVERLDAAREASSSRPGAARSLLVDFDRVESQAQVVTLVERKPQDVEMLNAAIQKLLECLDISSDFSMEGLREAFITLQTKLTGAWQKVIEALKELFALEDGVYEIANATIFFRVFERAAVKSDVEAGQIDERFEALSAVMASDTSPMAQALCLSTQADACAQTVGEFITTLTTTALTTLKKLEEMGLDTSFTKDVSSYRAVLEGSNGSSKETALKVLYQGWARVPTHSGLVDLWIRYQDLFRQQVTQRLDQRVAALEKAATNFRESVAESERQREVVDRWCKFLRAYPQVRELFYWRFGSRTELYKCDNPDHYRRADRRGRAAFLQDWRVVAEARALLAGGKPVKIVGDTHDLPEELCRATEVSLQSRCQAMQKREESVNPEIIAAEGAVAEARKEESASKKISALRESVDHIEGSIKVLQELLFFFNKLYPELDADKNRGKVLEYLENFISEFDAAARKVARWQFDGKQLKELFEKNDEELFSGPSLQTIQSQLRLLLAQGGKINEADFAVLMGRLQTILVVIASQIKKNTPQEFGGAKAKLDQLLGFLGCFASVPELLTVKSRKEFISFLFPLFKLCLAWSFRVHSLPVTGAPAEQKETRERRANFCQQVLAFGYVIATQLYYFYRAQLTPTQGDQLSKLMISLVQLAFYEVLGQASPQEEDEYRDIRSRARFATVICDEISRPSLVVAPTASAAAASSAVSSSSSEEGDQTSWQPAEQVLRVQQALYSDYGWRRCPGEARVWEDSCVRLGLGDQASAFTQLRNQLETNLFLKDALWQMMQQEESAESDRSLQVSSMTQGTQVDSSSDDEPNAADTADDASESKSSRSANSEAVQPDEDPQAAIEKFIQQCERMQPLPDKVLDLLAAAQGKDLYIWSSEDNEKLHLQQRPLQVAPRSTSTPTHLVQALYKIGRNALSRTNVVSEIFAVSSQLAEYTQNSSLRWKLASAVCVFVANASKFRQSAESLSEMIACEVTKASETARSRQTNTDEAVSEADIVLTQGQGSSDESGDGAEVLSQAAAGAGSAVEDAAASSSAVTEDPKKITLKNRILEIFSSGKSLAEVLHELITTVIDAMEIEVIDTGSSAEKNPRIDVAYFPTRVENNSFVQVEFVGHIPLSSEEQVVPRYNPKPIMFAAAVKRTVGASQEAVIKRREHQREEIQRAVVTFPQNLLQQGLGGAFMVFAAVFYQYFRWSPREAYETFAHFLNRIVRDQDYRNARAGVIYLTLGVTNMLEAPKEMRPVIEHQQAQAHDSESPRGLAP